MLASRGPEDEASAPPAPAVVSLRGTPAPKADPDNAERLRRERLARLERMREFDRQEEGSGEPSGSEAGHPDAPDEGEDPAMVGKSVERQLADLDAQTRTALQDAVDAYHGQWKKAEMNYLVACADQLAAAQEAGDLDAALFWRSEAEAVRRNGEPPREDEGVPPAARDLRREWRDTLNPLAGPIEEGRASYWKACEAMAADMEDGSGQSLLQERLAVGQEFSRFLAFCRGEAQRSVEPEVPEREPGKLTERVTEARRILDEKMTIYERRGDKVGMISLVKAFGRLLVAEEKDLVRTGNLDDALAVRGLKEEMLARLEEIEGSSSGEPEAAPAGPKSLALVEGGKVAESCEWDRRTWRRRGDALENGEDGAYLNSRLAIGPGDFSITMRLTMERIGATWLRLMVGETMVILDGDSGLLKVERGGALPHEAKGRSLSSNVRAGEPFTCRLERTGGLLKVVVGEEELLAADIHDRELGKVHFSSGKARIALEDLVLKGTLREAPVHEVLIDRAGPRRYTARLQLLPLEDGELLAMAALWGGGQHGDARDIWGRRSRDGGKKWDELDQVVSPRDHGGHMDISFAAASDPELDRVWTVYAAGKANQNVYVKEGRSGGRAWSGQQDITGIAKEQGWNVWLAAQGVVLQRNEKEKGRILLPMLAGPGEERGLYLLVSEDGKSWRRMGPLIEKVWRQAEIMEDETGRVWVATGSSNPHNQGFLRSWVVSEDGGETWSSPRPSTLADSGHTRGSLALGQDHAGKPVWYYVNVDRPPGPGSSGPDNLTLYGSRDGGRTWVELRRFHFGRGDYPDVMATGPGRVGILYRRERHSWDTIQARFLQLDGLWREK